MEGWYLLSDGEVEQVLLGGPPDPSRAMSVEEALAHRAGGNVPDAEGRSLRLILEMEGSGDVGLVEEKRRLYEPDFMEAPTWRRTGSRPINVIPLGLDLEGTSKAWWEDADIAPLDDEWRRNGTIGNVIVPAEYRGLVFKTVVSLRRAGKPVTAETIADSAARWLPGPQAEDLRSALSDRRA